MAAGAEHGGERAQPSLHDQLLDAVEAAVISEGWPKLRIAAIATKVGVSRQTVYNELGAKPEIAEALITREAETFAAVIARQMDAHRHDLVAAVGAAAEHSLRHAAESPMLAAILRPAEGNELLPLRAIRAARIASGATDVIVDRLDRDWPDLPVTPEERRFVVDAFVRLVISHITDPTDAPPDLLGAALAAMVERMAQI